MSRHVYIEQYVLTLNKGKMIGHISLVKSNNVMVKLEINETCPTECNRLIMELSFKMYIINTEQCMQQSADFLTCKFV